MKFNNLFAHGTFIGVMMITSALPVYSNDSVKSENPFKKVRWEKVNAKRKIAGVLSHNRLMREKYNDRYVNVLEYYVDTNGDKQIDYVLKQIIADGQSVPGHEHGAVLEFTESADNNGNFYIEKITPLVGYMAYKNKLR